jgi:hypothetical protein
MQSCAMVHVAILLGELKLKSKMEATFENFLPSAILLFVKAYPTHVAL